MYKDNIKLSKFCLGAMRLPQTAPRFAGPIDESKAQEIIDYCMALGVNYYDTAYIYHGGKSEVVLGRALSKYPRESFYIADKFNVQANPDYKAQFVEQLARLQTEYIDFYLLHGVTDLTVSDYEVNGCISYFEEQKRTGKIKYLGFSFHGTPDCLRKLLEKYRWDFVQVQFNFLDENFQAGIEGIHYAHEKGLAVMVMEPLRGGVLTHHIPKEALKIYERDESRRTPAEWALRWVWNHPEITVVLSGMNEDDHVQENIRIAENALPNSMSEVELAVISELKQQYHFRIGCTGCAYCMPCPAGINIPLAFSHGVKQGLK